MHGNLNGRVAAPYAPCPCSVVGRVSRGSGDVLNGIAYDPVSSNDQDGYRLFLTGKLWGRMHEVRWFPKRF
jgi:glutamine cyclotransferase